MKKEPDEKKSKLSASLFRRLLAVAIDSVILAITGFLLSIPFSGIFFTLGYHGWWIGFLISLLYYSVSATARFQGQSIGARILGIATINITGKYLSLQSALIRYALLLIIFYNSSILELIPYSHLNLLIIGGILAFSYITAFFVIILFNKYHRGLHDIATGSVVVNKKAFDSLSADEKKELIKAPVTSSKPLKISAVLIGFILIGGITLAVINPLKNTFFGDLYKTIKVIEKQTGLRIPSIMLRTYIFQGSKPSKAIVVTARVDRNTFNNVDKLRDLDAQIKKQVIINYSNIRQVDDLIVVFNSGYSIGIWTYNESISGSPTNLEPLKNK